MEANTFKPGDRVQLNRKGPVMNVIGSAKRYNILLGWYEDNTLLECSWYDERKGYLKRNFLSRNLTPALKFNYLKKSQSLNNHRISK